MEALTEKERIIGEVISDWLSYLSEYNVPTTQEDIDTMENRLRKALALYESRIIKLLEEHADHREYHNIEGHKATCLDVIMFELISKLTAEGSVQESENE